MEQFDKFEKFLQQEFEHYEADTNDESWALIREKLHPKTKRRFFGFWLFPIVGILGGALLIYNFSPNLMNTGNSASLISSVNLKSGNIASERTGNGEMRKEEMTQLDKVSTLKVNSIATATKDKTGFNSIRSVKRTSRSHFDQNAENSNLEKAAEYKIPAPIEETVISKAVSAPENFAAVSGTIPVASPDLNQIAILAPAFVSLYKPFSISRTENYAIVNPVHNQKNKGVRLYGSVGISNNYREMTANSTDTYYMSDVQAPAATSIDRLGFQVSLGFKYQITKQLAVRPAVNYQGYYHKLDYIVYENELNRISGIANGNSFEFSSIEYKNTQIKERNFNHSIGLQADLMYSFNTKNALVLGGGLGRMLSPAGTNTQWLNLSWQHRLNRYAIEPFAQMSLRKYTSNNNYYYYQPFSFGIKFGF